MFHSSAGSGVVPMKEIIISLIKDGYDGWFTVEHYGSRNMLTDAGKSVEFLINIGL